MDPSDLRAELAERLANSTAIDAETFNAACFVLSRALESLEFSVPAAAPLVRRLLRVAGHVVIDTAAAHASPDIWPNTQEMTIQLYCSPENTYVAPCEFWSKHAPLGK